MRIIKNGQPTELSQALKKASDARRAGRPGSNSRKELRKGGIAGTADLQNHSESSRSDSFLRDGLADEILNETIIETNSETSNETLAEEGERNAHQKAYRNLLEKGVKLLSMREHGVAEIHRKLKAKSDHVDLIDQVVQELIELGYLSDERFCEAFVRSRSIRGAGPAKIRMELIKKGINNNNIDEYLNIDSQHWFELAAQQYSKKFGDTAVVDYKDWSRRARFLQGRGFSMDHIQACIPEIAPC